MSGKDAPLATNPALLCRHGLSLKVPLISVHHTTIADTPLIRNRRRFYRHLLSGDPADAKANGNKGGACLVFKLSYTDDDGPASGMPRWKGPLKTTNEGYSHEKY
jgi:hypothetical protein